MNGRESGIIQNKFSRLSLIVGLDRMKQQLTPFSILLPSFSLHIAFFPFVYRLSGMNRLRLFAVSYLLSLSENFRLYSFDESGRMKGLKG